MVMPLYDDNPFRLRRPPIVTWGLMGFSLLILLVDFSTRTSLEEMVTRYGLVPAAFVGDGFVPGALPPALTLFSYMFLHADIFHLFGNMIFLWVFGDNVEEALGRVRFLFFYVACGVIGALVFVASDVHSEIPLIGASGAIAGVVVAYVMLRPCAKVLVLVSIIPLRLSAYWVVGAFVILQIVNLGAASKSEVAYWCHFGGMVAGAALLLLLRPAGVELFKCLKPEDVPAPTPDTSQVSGAP